MNKQGQYYVCLIRNLGVIVKYLAQRRQSAAQRKLIQIAYASLFEFITFEHFSKTWVHEGES